MSNIFNSTSSKVFVRIVRSLATAGVLVLAATLESCKDGLLHTPAPAAPAVVRMKAVLQQTEGGAPQAFDRADHVFLRLKVGDEVRLEQVLAFGPSAALQLDVPLRHVSETMAAEVELRMGDRPLFRATATPTLTSGEQTPVEFALAPVVDHVTCGTDVVQLTAYGQTAQLSGAALFATGDTVRGAQVAWTAASTPVLSVNDAGLVTAMQDGDAQATCGTGGVSATRAVHVFATVDHVQVLPTTATLVVGNSLPLTATLFDVRGNVITSARPVAWTSASSGVASVTSSDPATGVVAAVVAGNARISATSGGASGNADVTVVATSSVVTNAVTGISGAGATLLGTVNPRGSPAQVWFEWGTDPTLATSTATTAKSVTAASADVAFTETLAGLSNNTTYYFRAVASSAGGVVRGAIVSFVTLRPPTASTLDLSIGNSIVAFGSVNPNGVATGAWFRYGSDATLATFLETTHQAIGSGTTPVSFSQALSNLQPLTTYYVRAVGTGAGGTAVGSVLSFTTGGAPAVSAVAGTAGTSCVFTAQITARGNPNGALSEGWIDYSSNANLAGFTSTAHQSLGNGSGFVSFSATIQTGGAATYFRAVVTNAFGAAVSSVQGVFPPPCVR